MPNHSNSAAARRLARRANPPEDPKRMDLLAKILEESSSISLNDNASQLSAKQAIDSHSRLFELLDELRKVESNIDPVLPCRTSEKWTKFFNWIDGELSHDDKVELSNKVDVVQQEQQSGSSNTKSTSKDDGHQNYSNEIDKNAEHCLIAKVPIKKGEKVFSIDRKIMLTTETAKDDLDLFDFIRKDSIASGMQNVVLVLHLLNEYSKQERSYWWPYLSILPNRLLPILTLDKDELKYLIASSRLSEALKMIRAISRQYSYFYKCLQATKLPLRKDFTFAYYAWGVSVVCSRQNEIPTSDRQACLSPIVHALIPVLDMCNHDRHSIQATFENNQSSLIASKDLNLGDEITINYGCRSSGEFFIHNGFVPDFVPYDSVPVTIMLNKQHDELFDDKAKLLKILNMPVFGRFKLLENTHENRHKRDPHLTMFLIVYFLNKDELNFLMTCQNPVGIADDIYEHVQYGQMEQFKDNTNNCCNGAALLIDSNDRSVLETMKKRLANCICNYLSKRAAISVALIDRAVNLYCSRHNLKSDKVHIDDIENPAVRLLLREKSVFNSYVTQ